MRCESIDVIDRGDVREYVCRNISLARLLRIDETRKILSIDVLAPWNLPIDQSLKVGDVQLIYHMDSINDLIWEFVGYDDGSRRELISVRIIFRDDVKDTYIKELIARVLNTYMEDP